MTDIEFTWYRIKYWFRQHAVLLVFLGVFVFLGLVGYAMYNQGTKMNAVRTQCVGTSLYVIGDKGHVNQVYDCGGVKL